MPGISSVRPSDTTRALQTLTAAGDLLYCAVAVIIRFGGGRFKEKRLRAFWETQKKEEWLLHSHQNRSDRSTRLQKALTRAPNDVENYWEGTRWRRDVEIQAAALISAIPVTVGLWYQFIYPSAGELYDFTSAVIGDFDSKAYTVSFASTKWRSTISDPLLGMGTRLAVLVNL